MMKYARFLGFAYIIFSPVVNASGLQLIDYRSLRYATVVGQTTDYTCGPAALATLLTYYYGIPVSEQIMTERAESDMALRGKEVTSGLTMLSLKNALIFDSIPSDGYKLTIDQLRTVMLNGLPIIANVQYPKGHYYLIIGLDQHSILVADPTWGIRSQPLEKFLYGWSGVVLIPQPSTEQASYAREQVNRQVSVYNERIQRLRTGG